MPNDPHCDCGNPAEHATPAGPVGGTGGEFLAQLSRVISERTGIPLTVTFDTRPINLLADDGTEGSGCDDGCRCDPGS